MDGSDDAATLTVIENPSEIAVVRNMAPVYDDADWLDPRPHSISVYDDNGNLASSEDPNTDNLYGQIEDETISVTSSNSASPMAQHRGGLHMVRTSIGGWMLQVRF